MEFVKQIDYFTQCHFMCDRDNAITSTRGQNCIQAIVFTMMLTSLQSRNHFIYQIINIQQLQPCRAIIDIDRLLSCYIVTKSSHHTIIIRTAPLTEKIWETVDQDFCPRLLSILEEQLLACQLRFAIIRIPISTNQRCLNAT